MAGGLNGVRLDNARPGRVTSRTEDTADSGVFRTMAKVVLRNVSKVFDGSVRAVNQVNWR